MNRQIIHPENEAAWLELRKNDITSTEISALFGISPYATLFEVWHRHKNGFAVEFQSNERVKWGSRLESAIADGIAKDEGFTIRRMKEYIRLPEIKIGSSFDFSIIKPIAKTRVGDLELSPGLITDEGTATFVDEGGLLEIKNVDALQLRDKWIIDGDNIEAPPHIELQVQHQLLVSGCSFAHIGALVGGNKVILIRREADIAIQNAIMMKAKDFWTSIDRNEEPKPNFADDADFISKLYGYAEPGKIFNADSHTKLNALMDLYRGYASEAKRYENLKDACKAEALTIIGDSEKVIGNGWSISAGIVGECEMKFTRKAFRNFRATFKKTT